MNIFKIFLKKCPLCKSTEIITKNKKKLLNVFIYSYYCSKCENEWHETKKK